MATKKGRIIIGIVLAASCGKSSEQRDSLQTVGRQPEVAPSMLNKELPFRYPPALFAQKVQGNVTLRIYIDRLGQIVPESTHVAETSGFSALDSAAVKGSRDLRFVPAKTGGQPVPVSILLPVFFRYPGATPLPGDSVLKGRPPASSTVPTVNEKPKATPVDTAARSAPSVPAKAAVTARTPGKATPSRRARAKASPRRAKARSQTTHTRRRRRSSGH